MAIFATEWKGCKAGDIYPTDFAAGDECPAELLGAAIASGVIEGEHMPTEPSELTEPSEPEQPEQPAGKRGK